MMTVAIFPSVSDSDDLFNFSLLRIPAGQSSGVGTVPAPDDSREKDSLHLARILETLEYFQVEAVYILVLAVFCLGAMVSVRHVSPTRAIRCHGGRAPPLALSCV
jgi:hypothetical protein